MNSISSRSMSDIGLRPGMEDRHGIVHINDTCTLAWVADGHGGDYVSSHIDKFIEEVIRQSCEDTISADGGLEDDAIRLELKLAFDCLNDMLHPIKAAECGSTLVLALIFPTRVIVANCGDSRAIWCHGMDVVGSTEDHSATNENEVQRIRDTHGIIVFNRIYGVLSVFRALGDMNYQPSITCAPEVYAFKRSECTCLVLASDGVWDNLTNADVARIIGEAHGDPDKAIKVLHHDSVFHVNADDNVTAVVLYI
jgi:serine/threonine protein phosphatase PrpC